MSHVVGPSIGLMAILLALPGAGRACAEVRHVDDSAPPGGDGQSWRTPHRFLADALEGAPAGTEIRVAGGVYRPDRSEEAPDGSGERTASFVLSGGIALRGGYAGFGAEDPDLRDPVAFLTLLDGDLLGDDGGGLVADNAFHVVRVEGPPAANVIDGVVISGGNASGTGSKGVGGGLLVTGGTPAIIGTGIWNNRAKQGGGLRLEAPLAGGVISGCTFLNNVATGGGAAGGGGGAIDVIAGDLDVLFCIFYQNSSQGHGGAITARAAGASFTLLGSLVSSSTTAVSGAVTVWDDVHADIRDCTFELNQAQIGPAGLAVYQGGAVVARCTFTGNGGGTVGAAALWDVDGDGGPSALVSGSFWNNTSGFHGAALLTGHPCALANIEAAENLATGGGALEGRFDLRHATLVDNAPDGVFLTGPTTIHHSILWANTPEQIQFGGDAEVSVSLVEGGWPEGEAIVDADPLLVAPEARDLRLGEGSPALDAGDLALVPPDVADLDQDGNTIEPLPFDRAGLPRVTDGAPDLGAHEGATGVTPPQAVAGGIEPGVSVSLSAGNGTAPPVLATITNLGEDPAEAALQQIGFDPAPGAGGLTEDGQVAALGTTIDAGAQLTQLRIPISLYTLYPHGDLAGMRCTRFDEASGAWRLAVAMNADPAANGANGSPVGAFHLLVSVNGSPVSVPTTLGDHGVVWSIPELTGIVFANVDRDGLFGVGRNVCTIDVAPEGGDGVVDGADIGVVLAQWGSSGASLAGDVDGSGSVDGGDLGLLLSHFGGCLRLDEDGLADAVGAWAAQATLLGLPLPPQADGVIDPRAADLTADGAVDAEDLGLMLFEWGGAGGAADLDGDGDVDGGDVGLLLGAWTSA